MLKSNQWQQQPFVFENLSYNRGNIAIVLRLGENFTFTINIFAWYNISVTFNNSYYMFLNFENFITVTKLSP
jgi:hypothetical protein